MGGLSAPEYAFTRFLQKAWQLGWSGGSSEVAGSRRDSEEGSIERVKNKKSLQGKKFLITGLNRQQ